MTRELKQGPNSKGPTRKRPTRTQSWPKAFSSDDLKFSFLSQEKSITAINEKNNHYSLEMHFAAILLGTIHSLRCGGGVWWGLGKVFYLDHVGSGSQCRGKIINMRNKTGWHWDRSTGHYLILVAGVARVPREIEWSHRGKSEMLKQQTLNQVAQRLVIAMCQGNRAMWHSDYHGDVNRGWVTRSKAMKILLLFLLSLGGLAFIGFHVVWNLETTVFWENRTSDGKGTETHDIEASSGGCENYSQL